MIALNRCPPGWVQGRLVNAILPGQRAPVCRLATQLNYLIGGSRLTCHTTPRGNQGRLEIAAAGGVDRRSARRRGRATPRGGHEPDAGGRQPLLRVVADYTGLSATPGLSPAAAAAPRPGRAARPRT